MGKRGDLGTSGKRWDKETVETEGTGLGEGGRGEEVLEGVGGSRKVRGAGGGRMARSC